MACLPFFFSLTPIDVILAFEDAMGERMKPSALKELQQIPGVGIKTAEVLWGLGIRSVQDLKGKDPDQLYQKLCTQQHKQVDRCVLYVFRCAVYYASNKKPKPRLLKWWNWKNRK